MRTSNTESASPTTYGYVNRARALSWRNFSSFYSRLSLSAQQHLFASPCGSIYDLAWTVHARGCRTRPDAFSCRNASHFNRNVIMQAVPKIARARRESESPSPTSIIRQFWLTDFSVPFRSQIVDGNAAYKGTTTPSPGLINLEALSRLAVAVPRGMHAQARPSKAFPLSVSLSLSPPLLVFAYFAYFAYSRFNSARWDGYDGENRGRKIRATLVSLVLGATSAPGDWRNSRRISPVICADRDSPHSAECERQFRKLR